MFCLIQDFRSNLIASLKVSREKDLGPCLFPLDCYTKRLTLNIATLFWPQFFSSAAFHLLDP